MSIGVATANSILLVTFANDERASIPRRARGDAVGRLRPHPAGADDRGRDDPGHAADGARARRGRRAERAARPRRHRRTARRDGDDAVRRADHLFVSAPEAAGQPGAAAEQEEEAEEDEELRREHEELDGGR